MSTSPNGPDTGRWQRHRAGRVLAQYARDAEDLGELLDMLGLTAAEARYPPRAPDDAGQVPAPRAVSPTERILATTFLADVAEDLR